MAIDKSGEPGGAWPRGIIVVKAGNRGKREGRALVIPGKHGDVIQPTWLLLNLRLTGWIQGPQISFLPF